MITLYLFSFVLQTYKKLINDNSVFQFLTHLFVWIIPMPLHHQILNIAWELIQKPNLLFGKLSEPMYWNTDSELVVCIVLQIKQVNQTGCV